MRHIFLASLLMGIVSIMAIPEELKPLQYQFERIQKATTARQEFSHLATLQKLCVDNAQALQGYQSLLDALCGYTRAANALETKRKYTYVPSKGRRRQEVLREDADGIVQLGKAREQVSEEFKKLKDK